MRGLSGIETMRADWDRYFQQTTAGNTTPFAGGILKRGANDTTLFIKDGKTNIIHQSDTFDSVASKNPSIAQAWLTQYGFKVGTFVPASGSSGISPLALAAAAYAAYHFLG